jgi:xanthine/uracil permease
MRLNIKTILIFCVVAIIVSTGFQFLAQGLPEGLFTPLQILSLMIVVLGASSLSQPAEKRFLKNRSQLINISALVGSILMSGVLFFLIYPFFPSLAVNELFGMIILCAVLFVVSSAFKSYKK